LRETGLSPAISVGQLEGFEERDRRMLEIDATTGLRSIRSHFDLHALRHATEGRGRADTRRAGEATRLNSRSRLQPTEITWSRTASVFFRFRKKFQLERGLESRILQKLFSRQIQRIRRCAVCRIRECLHFFKRPLRFLPWVAVRYLPLPARATNFRSLA